MLVFEAKHLMGRLKTLGSICSYLSVLLHQHVSISFEITYDALKLQYSGMDAFVNRDSDVRNEKLFAEMTLVGFCENVRHFTMLA